MDTTTKPTELVPAPDDSAAKAESAVAAPAQNAKPVSEARIIDVLRTIYDPEIPVNIYEIGLIYNVDIDASNAVNVRMTLTSPACPAAGILPVEVEDKVRQVPGVTDVKVEVVWDPMWSPSMMSETARLQLGML